MRRICALLLIVMLLAGCTKDSGQMDRALNLRGRLQKSTVTFEVFLTADYGDKFYTFAMNCQADAVGNLKFSVAEPRTIAGISGTVSKGNGKLTFDDKVLGFDVLADGLISPVTGPWVLIETLRSGFLTSCAEEGDGLRLAIDDSYEEKALHLDIWLSSEDLPQRCEVFWQGRRLLSMEVKNFAFL